MRGRLLPPLLLTTLWSSSANAALPPEAHATASRLELFTGEELQLDGSASFDPEGQPLTFVWDLGDGTQVTGARPAHVYDVAGLRTITLSVSDGAASAQAYLEVVVLAPPTPGRATSSSPVALGYADRELWVVNPDSNTVSLVEVRAGDRVTEVPVGRAPRSLALSDDGTLLFVACRDSDEVWVVDTAARAIVGKRRTGVGPVGVVAVPAGGPVLVTHEGSGTVVALDPLDLRQLGELHVGGTPRAIAVDAEGARAYVTDFLTRGERGRLTVVDVHALSIAFEVGLAEDPGPDTLSSGRGFPNLLGALAVEPSGERLWVGGLKANTGRGLFNDGTPLSPENRLRGVLLPVDLAASAELMARRIDTNDADGVSAVAFSPNGRHVYVTHQGAGTVSVYDLPHAATSGGGDGASVPFTTRLEVGDAPNGLAISRDGRRIYVNNALSRSVSVLDASVAKTPVKLAEIVVTAEALAPDVALGKRLFHRSRAPVHSHQNYVACASCHPDGGQDGRTWDFTQVGEGRRNTIELRGRAGLGHGPLHWTANFDEVQDFENDIVNGFGGGGLAHDGAPPAPPLGAVLNGGRSLELDALAAYVASLATFPQSPYREADGTLDAAARRGKRVFFDPAVGCASCHAPPRFTVSGAKDATGDYLRLDVGTWQPGSGQGRGEPYAGFDVPTLLGAFASPPYLHDGSAASLMEVLTTKNAQDLHGTTSHLSLAELEDLERFLLSLDGRSDELPDEEQAAPAPQSPGCAAAGPADTLAALLPLSLVYLRRRPQ